MALGFHIIVSTYGFWLPNDPRGASAPFVGSDALFQAAGTARPVAHRRSVAGVPHDRAARLAAKHALKFPPVRFTGPQAKIVAQAVAEVAGNREIPVWAFAILPDHWHGVIGGAADTTMFIGACKRTANSLLDLAAAHPLQAFREGKHVPSAFGGGHWKTFLDTSDAVRGAIRYVEANPVKARLPAQRWSFVAPFGG